MSMNLYELSSNFAELFDLIENEEVEQEVLADTLEAIEDGIENKVDNIAKIIKNLDGAVEVFKKEENRIAIRRKVMENRVKWLKEYLLLSLDVTKKKKIEAGTFVVRKQKNPMSVIVSDKSKLPKKYLIPQEPKEDKDAIKKALKNGEKVDGAEIKPDTYHIRIQ